MLVAVAVGVVIGSRRRHHVGGRGCCGWPSLH